MLSGVEAPFFRTEFLKMIKIKDKIYYTPQEYADRHMVTIQTVYNWIKDKRLEVKKLMDKTFVR